MTKSNITCTSTCLLYAYDYQFKPVSEVPRLYINNKKLLWVASIVQSSSSSSGPRFTLAGGNGGNHTIVT